MYVSFMHLFLSQEYSTWKLSKSEWFNYSICLRELERDNASNNSVQLLRMMRLESLQEIGFSIECFFKKKFETNIFSLVFQALMLFSKGELVLWHLIIFIMGIVYSSYHLTLLISFSIS